MKLKVPVSLINFLKDEDGDLIQNVLWLFGGVLSMASVTALLFGAMKNKIVDENNAVSRVPP